MPKFAVMLRYEVVSGLVVEANDQDEAVTLATEFEAAVHDGVEDAEAVESYVRIWGDGDATPEQADSYDEACDILDDWADELEIDDEYDEDDLDDEAEYDDDLESDDEYEDDDEEDEER